MGAACSSESIQIDASQGFPETIPPESEGSKLHTDLIDLNSKLFASIDALKRYDKSYGDKIKEALASSTEKQKQLDAYDAMANNIGLLNQYCQNSKLIVSLLPSGVSYLVAEDLPETIIFKDISELLRYILELDKIKSETPEISTDFFFYRRCKNKIADERTLPIGEQDSNNISMLIGHQTPLVKTSFDALDQGESNAAITLSKIAHFNLAYSRIHENDEKMNCYETIVAAVLIADMLLPDGVFAKTSPFKMDLIITDILAIGKPGVSLCKQIKYYSSTYNNSTTPSKISQKLDEID